VEWRRALLYSVFLSGEFDKVLYGGMRGMMLTLAGWLFWPRLGSPWLVSTVMSSVNMLSSRVGNLRAGSLRVGRERILSRRPTEAPSSYLYKRHGGGGKIPGREM
jgi:hypothetical protein